MAGTAGSIVAGGLIGSIVGTATLGSHAGPVIGRHAVPSVGRCHMHPLVVDLGIGKFGNRAIAVVDSFKRLDAVDWPSLNRTLWAETFHK